MPKLTKRANCLVRTDGLNLIIEKLFKEEIILEGLLKKINMFQLDIKLKLMLSPFLELRNLAQVFKLCSYLT